VTRDAGHVVPVKTYVAVFVALLALLCLTVGLAYVNMGVGNTIVALVIAVIKMLLVILFFMHAFYDRGLTRVVIVAGFLWLSILIVLSCSDVFTRHWTPSPQSWGPDISLPQK
jgi:cytochrome c oxidase subunit IV